MIRLGKLALYHCRECNIPLLKKAHEGVEAEHVKLTPPGDIRPAFDFDRKLIDEILKKQFGSSYVPEVTILNSIPAIDRSDEVIIDGRVAGALVYDIFMQKFKFQPRPWYASLLEIRKGYVIADDGAVEAILKTSNLMAPGVIEYDGEIRKGDEVVVLDRDWRVIATGMARMNAEEMNGRGMAVKIRWRGMEDVEKGRKITWNDVMEANREVILSHEAKAKKFVDDTIKKEERKAAVSFSGGKDSLATLLITMEAGYTLPMMFLNTGIEFDETLEHVYETASKYSLELLEEKAGDAFWKGIKLFGPPARDYRWCCKTCKLGVATRLIKKHFPEGVLSFIGQRRYESANRASHGERWFNPWVSNQIAASPIHNWTAMHIWLYLFMKKAKWNKLYEQGFYRIGCWLCPSSNMADFALKKHQRWDDFENELKNFALRHDLPEEWLRLGLWRWRRPPKWSGMKYEIKRERTYRMEGNEERVKNFLKILGKKGEEFAHRLQNGGIEIEKEDKDIRDVAYKAIECIGCGVCVGKCPVNAIRIEDGKAWIDDSCIACGQCMDECPPIVFM